MELSEARIKFADKLRTGKLVTCPCCRRVAKVYKRNFYFAQAKNLIQLYKRAGYWVHVCKMEDSARGGDFAKMKYWGLIRERTKDENDKKKRTSGYWTITKKGILFVTGKTQIPKYVLVYEGEMLKESEELINIWDTFEKRFDYEELMRTLSRRERGSL